MNLDDLTEDEYWDRRTPENRVFNQSETCCKHVACDKSKYKINQSYRYRFLCWLSRLIDRVQVALWLAKGNTYKISRYREGKSMVERELR